MLVGCWCLVCCGEEDLEDALVFSIQSVSGLRTVCQTGYFNDKKLFFFVKKKKMQNVHVYNVENHFWNNRNIFF